jgi:hypothetical protein
LVRSSVAIIASSARARSAQVVRIIRTQVSSKTGHKQAVLGTGITLRTGVTFSLAGVGILACGARQLFDVHIVIFVIRTIVTCWADFTRGLTEATRVMASRALRLHLSVTLQSNPGRVSQTAFTIVREVPAITAPFFVTA